jgi:hypothetical protein
MSDPSMIRSFSFNTAVPLRRDYSVVSPYSNTKDEARSQGEDKVMISTSTEPPGPYRLFSASDTAPRAEVDTWIRRAVLGGLAAISLAGAIIPSNAVYAAEAPKTAVSTTLNQPGASDFIIATGNQAGIPPPGNDQATVPGAEVQGRDIAATQAVQPDVAVTAVEPLPSPNALSMKLKDKVYINDLMEKLATKTGLPADLLKAIAWQESGWIHGMGERLTTQHNIDEHTGEIKSTDRGIMQINSRAHPRAFPGALTLEGNLEYGAKYLKSIVDQHGGGPQAVWRYNGDPEYGPLIYRHVQVKPWTVYVLRAQMNALRKEKTELQVRIPKSEKGLKVIEQRVKERKVNVGAWEKKVEKATQTAAEKSARKNLAIAQKSLAAAEESLAKATENLKNDKARLESLPAEIEKMDTRAKQEAVRLSTIQKEEYAALREEMKEKTTAHIARLVGLRGQALEASKALSEMEKKPRDLEVKGLAEKVAATKAQVGTLRQRLIHEESTWKQSLVKQKGGANVYRIRKDLKTAEKSLRQDEATLKTLRCTVSELRKALAKK